MVSGECGELALTINIIITPLASGYMTTIQPTEEEMLSSSKSSQNTFLVAFIFSTKWKQSLSQNEKEREWIEILKTDTRAWNILQAEQEH